MAFLFTYIEKQQLMLPNTVLKISCIPLPLSKESTGHYYSCRSKNFVSAINNKHLNSSLCDISATKGNSNFIKEMPVKSKQIFKSFRCTPNKSMDNKLVDSKPNISNALTRSNTFTRNIRNGFNVAANQRMPDKTRMFDSTKKPIIAGKAKNSRTTLCPRKNAIVSSAKTDPKINILTKLRKGEESATNNASKNFNNFACKLYYENFSKTDNTIQSSRNLKIRNNTNRMKNNSSQNILMPLAVESLSLKKNCRSITKISLQKSSCHDKEKLQSKTVQSEESNFKKMPERLGVTRNKLQCYPDRNNSDILKSVQPSRRKVTKFDNLDEAETPLDSPPVKAISTLSNSLKNAQSDLVLSLCENNPEYKCDKMASHELTTSLQDVNRSIDSVNYNLSFGLDFAESTLDCSIELVDVSLSSTVLSQSALNDKNCADYKSESLSSQKVLQQQHKPQQLLQKQKSFEMDESLGILTPEQMKEFLVSSANNTNNLEDISENAKNQFMLQQLRIEQTPSPEELPLDTIEVKTTVDPNDAILMNQMCDQECSKKTANMVCTKCASFHPDTDISKTDSINKISITKMSTSFITSVTSVTSLDTGYQGDGEMSRPVSRGASENSSSAIRFHKGVSRQPSFNLQQYHIPSSRRQDPMTDSDFFTESDADEIINKIDSNTHKIDGHIFTGHTLSPICSIQKEMDDSCMESSGVFTDIENRPDEDLRCQNVQQEIHSDSSPNADVDDVDGSDSTGTIKSNYENTKHLNSKVIPHNETIELLPNKFGRTPYRVVPSEKSLNIQNNVNSDNNSTTLSNRTSYSSSMDNNAMTDFQSVSSLNKAFNREATTDLLYCCNGRETQLNIKLCKSFTTSTTTPWDDHSLMCTQKPPPVQKVTSPRKYASLSSLCLQSNVDPSQISRDNHTITSNNSKQRAHRNGSLSSPVTSIKASKFLLKGNSKTTSNNSSISNKNKPRLKIIQKDDTICIKTLNNNNNNKVLNSENARSIVVRKCQVPNKWNSVMNQIEKNKSLTKTNYNNVKSKVVARLNLGVDLHTSSSNNNVHRRSSPSSPSTKIRLTSPNLKLTNKLDTNNCNGGGSGGNVGSGSDFSTKRGPFTADRSKVLTGVPSPPSKCTAKTSLRTAKKRDVRNLSISSSNLGPPSKTQQTLNGVTARSKVPPTPSACTTLAQKRQSSNSNDGLRSTSNTNSTAVSVPNAYHESKSSVSSKKSALAKYGSIKNKNKTSSADVDNHRSLKTSVSSAAESLLKSVCQEETELNGIRSVDLKISDDGSGSYTSGTSTPRLTKKQSSTNVRANGNDEDNYLGEEDEPSSNGLGNQTYQVLDSKNPLSISSLTLKDKDGDQLNSINCSSCNNFSNNQTLEKPTAAQNNTQGRAIEALAILLNYLVYDLDAFACQSIKAENLKAKEQLKKTVDFLEQTKCAFNELRKELCEKEHFYKQRECDLQALHSGELEKVYTELTQWQSLTKTQIHELEMKLRSKDAESKCIFDTYRNEMEKKIAEKDEEIKAAKERERSLHQRFIIITQSEQELREKLTCLETSCAGRLQLAVERENELTDRVKCLSTDLKKLKNISKVENDNHFKDKLNLSEDEMSVLRSTRRSLNESNLFNSQRNANDSASPSLSNIEMNRLQSEAESLRCVLELKQKEISKLTKHNEELVRDAEIQSSLKNKISLLKSKMELLQSEVKIKAEKEKELLRQIDDLQKAINHETIKRTRLSYDNEALQWQLKQRSEQLHIIESKLSELSTNNDSLPCTNSCQNFSNNNCLNMDDISPPLSPVVTGVIEKTDSVSWVLKMDDQTPEIAASKVVKRAGSFRSVERSPSARRQCSVGANVPESTVHSHSHLNLNKPATEIKIHPLSQSASATLVVPEHSKMNVESTNSSHSRIRSRSVSIKTDADTDAAVNSIGEIQRQYSEDCNKSELCEMSMLCCQKSNVNAVETLSSHSSSVNTEDTESLFDNTSGGALITCDMTTLNAGEPLDIIKTVSKHSSVKSLNINKKSQEIQESAGEALISDINSDDESCSAFSDDAISLASTVSNISGSPVPTCLKSASSTTDSASTIEKMNTDQETIIKISWPDDNDSSFVNSSSL